jgi:tRNA 2-thiouridine synthesizing protein C
LIKRYLFILQKAAYSGDYAQEMLDIILTTAAFDQSVSILLLDDSIFQLKKYQCPKKCGMKDIAAIFSALEIYDVKDIYIERESLYERGLSTDDLCLPVQVLARKEITELIQKFDIVFSG